MTLVAEARLDGCMVARFMTDDSLGEDRKDVVSIRQDDEEMPDWWEALTVRLRKHRVVSESSVAGQAQVVEASRETPRSIDPAHAACTDAALDGVL